MPDPLFFQMRDELFVYRIPVHEVPERLDILCPVVLVVHVGPCSQTSSTSRIRKSRLDVHVMLLDLVDKEMMRRCARRKDRPAGALDTRSRLCNSFLNRSNHPNSSSIAFASSPFGAPPPPFPAVQVLPECVVEPVAPDMEGEFL